jgi:hypothetical protein
MSGRRAAFDPARLTNDLDELLPPPPPNEPVAAEPDPPPAVPMPTTQRSPADEIPASDGPGESGRRPPRGGNGGRPPGHRAHPEDTGTTTAAVRIPKPLYDAVVRDLLGSQIERPSYAQVVGWTCEDHAKEVVAELRHAISTAGRAPRGRKLATEGVPLTLRLKPAERAALDEVSRTAGATAKVTRTAVVTAALRVAVKYGVSVVPTADIGVG